MLSSRQINFNVNVNIYLSNFEGFKKQTINRNYINIFNASAHSPKALRKL